MGAPGKMGPKGPGGPKGNQGAKGEQGTPVSQRNWKQCAWKNINDGRDYGLIKVREIGRNWFNKCFLEVSKQRKTSHSERITPVHSTTEVNED